MIRNQEATCAAAVYEHLRDAAGPVPIRDVLRSITGWTRNTVKRQVLLLVSDGLIVRRARSLYSLPPLWGRRLNP